eukprot:10566143-Alexandrium_andersonii.AAC.1
MRHGAARCKATSEDRGRSIEFFWQNAEVVQRRHSVGAGSRKPVEGDMLPGELRSASARPGHSACRPTTGPAQCRAE